MKKLLLIDDSSIFLNVVSTLLSKNFEIVGKAKDGNEGFKMFKEASPDLVLLDITMPNCNGKDCLKMILENNKSARIIMVSSVGDKDTIDECIKLGAKDFIKKEEISVKSEEKIANFITKIENVLKVS